MGTRVRGWRWRSNPLRRRSDVLEAWTVLAVAVLLLVAAPVAGVIAAWWAHGEARAVATEQRADRQRVRAEVVGRPSDSLPSVQGGRGQTVRATVRWSEPGGGPRTATARVPAGTDRGDTVEVWFDTRGRNVPPPPNETSVWQHTLTVGTCAAGGACAVILLGRAVVLGAVNRRRMADWERDWALIEPQWTRRRA